MKDGVNYDQKHFCRFEISNTDMICFLFDVKIVYLPGYLVSNFLTWPFLYPAFWFCIYGFETISLSKQKKYSFVEKAVLIVFYTM